MRQPIPLISDEFIVIMNRVAELANKEGRNYHQWNFWIKTAESCARFYNMLKQEKFKEAAKHLEE